MKPILFNIEMVQAILDGRKTVTRRLVKPQLENAHMIMDVSNDTAEFMCGRISSGHCIDFAEYRKLPYRIGDILYVRETWQKTYINDGTTHPTDFKYEYKASDEQRTVYRWRPSIHMPKEAARIFLKVTDVRVERLQEITIDGINHEGISLVYPLIKLIDSEHLEKFIEIWNSTINKYDYGSMWQGNPWVWVIEFEKIEKGELGDAL